MRYSEPHLRPGDRGAGGATPAGMRVSLWRDGNAGGSRSVYMSTMDLHLVEGDDFQARPATAGGEVLEAEALDAYSRIVTGVAEQLAPSVANLQVYRRLGGGRRFGGGGSGVVISPDGFLLTSAHVVSGTDRGEASFEDGSQVGLEVVGADELSDLAVLRA